MSTAVALLEKNVDTRKRGLGCVEVSRDQKRIKLPLTGVDIRARVADRLAHVTVKETFQNPYSEHLEAVYVFPLSGGCAVSSFKMKVGDRVIDGKVDERQAARAEYAQAIQDGKRTALLEQEREDVFTVQVGNLPPGEEITVILTYSEKLAYFDDGTTEIRLPLVVAPRYIPGDPLDRENVGDGTECDTDQVPDASRITPPRLAAGIDPKIALGISVELVADQPIEGLGCSQHATKLGSNKEGLTASLSRDDELLDRDFVLRWRLATDRVQSKFLVFRNPENNNQCYGFLSLMPPKGTEIAKPARDVIFVVDRSGSMGGLKMVSAARACSFLLATLGPRDRFAIQAFDDRTEWMNASKANRFLDADEAGIDAGDKYLRTIDARGGTELEGALTDAIGVMKTRANKTARMPVIVILTDGEVGNEAGIFKRIQQELGDNRVFTIGIDTAVNDGFLKRLATLGGGTTTFVEPGAQLETALKHVGREIGTPIITDLTLDDVNCGLDKKSIAPNKIADLFEGRAVSAFFRLSAAKLKDLSTGKIKVKGRFANGKNFEEIVSPNEIDVPALAQLWAKTHVSDLEDQYRLAQGGAQRELHKEIVSIAVAHSLLTKFTAFVVVDHSEVVNKDGSRRKVVQAVQNPSKWEMQQAQAPAARMHMKAKFGIAPASSMFDASEPLTLAESIRRKIQSPQNAPVSPPQGGSTSWRVGSYGSGPAAGAPMPQPQPMQSSQPMQAPQAPRIQKDMECDDGLANNQACHEWGAPPTGGSDGWAASLTGGAQSMDKKAAAPPQASLKKSYDEFEKALKSVFDSIRDGKLAAVDELDQRRTDLIYALSLSPTATKMPLLQKYLRAELLQLIAALTSATAVDQQLKDFGTAQESIFEAVQQEASMHIDAAAKPFWEANV